MSSQDRSSEARGDSRMPAIFRSSSKNRLELRKRAEARRWALMSDQGKDVGVRSNSATTGSRDEDDMTLQKERGNSFNEHSVTLVDEEAADR